MRTAEVVEAALAPQVAAVGSIAFNERDQAVVQARATGFVEKLHVRATLDRVSQRASRWPSCTCRTGSPRRRSSSRVRRMQGSDLEPLIDGARQRMRQVGMSEAQIALVERSGRTQPRITLARADRRRGHRADGARGHDGDGRRDAVPHQRRSAPCGRNAEVPESQAALLRPGAQGAGEQPGAARASTFDGRVQAILPEVNPATRTLKARVELANPRRPAGAGHVRADAVHRPAHRRDRCWCRPRR